jgi:UDP-glucose 4-epimerase
MKTYLVTGGCGFIGSHLCDALLARGHAVRVLDDLSSGTRANLQPEMTFRRGDVRDPETIAAALEGVDGVFHLAAIASVERGVREWAETHRVNLGGTIAVLDGIRRLPASVRCVYASSAAVYGDCAALPIVEGADRRPLSAYGADKLGSEQHARVATHVHGIPTVGLRFFNVYGPRQDPASPYSGVISVFVERFGTGRPVAIHGDGRQTRDFIFVADVVAALMRAMTVPLADAETFNVCSGMAVSVLELAGLVAELSGVAADLRFEPPRRGDIRHSLGSPAASRAALGTGEPTSLRDGLRQLIDYAAERRRATAVTTKAPSRAPSTVPEIA